MNDKIVSEEIRDRKEIDILLSGGSTTGALPAWVWNCAHCGHEHVDPKFTKHGKYRKCNQCKKGNMVCLPY